MNKLDFATLKSLFFNGGFPIYSQPRSVGTSGRGVYQFHNEETHMSRSRYRIVENEYPYFLTGTVVGWLPIFSRPKTVQIIFDSWNYLRDQLHSSESGRTWLRRS